MENMKKVIKTLYTKTAFECQGLEIKLDFDSHIEYEVFYYKSNGNFLESSGVLENGYTANVPALATHARIEITPEWDELGDDYAKEKDQVIKWYEVTKYSSQMEVRIAIDQDVEQQNLFAFDSSMNNKQYANDYVTSTLDGYYNSKLLSVSNVEKVTIVIPPKDSNALNKYAIFGFTADNKYIYQNLSGVTETQANIITNADGTTTFEFTNYIDQFVKIGIQTSGLSYICELYVE